jgi:hypothetical protein
VRLYTCQSLLISLLTLFFTERALATGNANLLLPVLAHHPIYGVSVPTPSKARELFQSILSPASGPSLLHSTKAKGLHLQQGLDLAQVLAGTRVKVPIRNSLKLPTQSTTVTLVDQGVDSSPSKFGHISLSPFEDMVSGSILLAALVRAMMEPSSVAKHSIEDYWKAVAELINSLRAAGRSDKLLFSSILREQVWTLAALRQVKQSLNTNKEALITISETQSVPSESAISFEALVSWTDNSLTMVAGILEARGKTGIKATKTASGGYSKGSTKVNILEQSRSLSSEQAQL